MASGDQNGERTTTGCLACRGTGAVSSSLGGTPHQVVCPWCRGTGERIPGIDAQQEPSETRPALEA